VREGGREGGSVHICIYDSGRGITQHEGRKEEGREGGSEGARGCVAREGQANKKVML